jgi:hypothetical protein
LCHKALLAKLGGEEIAMTRSRRKTPITGITCAESDKPFKRAEHSRERSRVRQALHVGEEPPHPKAFGNPWKSEKDGKQYVRTPSELMRK